MKFFAAFRNPYSAPPSAARIAAAVAIALAVPKAKLLFCFATSMGIKMRGIVEQLPYMARRYADGTQRQTRSLSARGTLSADMTAGIPTRGAGRA